MPHKPWDEAAQAPDGPAAPPGAGPSLLDLAAGNPDLLRLLEERDRLERRMQEIAAGSPGSFAPAHDNVRFPVEPQGQRRAGEARWVQAREESRSAAVQRILDARRKDAAAGVVQARRAEKAAVVAALDARLELSRQDVLSERWRARAQDAGDDWFALRERQATEALAEARARTAEAAEREQALDRRISRARSEQRDSDWSEQRERRRARALEMARRQTAEAAAAEQALDERVARAREERLRENRLAHDPSREAHRTSPSSLGGGEPTPREPMRRLPPTAAERSLDERLVRAGKNGSKERHRASPSPGETSRGLRATAVERPSGEQRSEARKATPKTSDRFADRSPSSRFAAAPPLRDLDAPAQRGSGSRSLFHDRPGHASVGPNHDARRGLSGLIPAAPDRQRIAGEESFGNRRDHVRATLAEARKLERKVSRAAARAITVADRAAGGARDADRTLGQVSDNLRAFGDDDLAARLDRLRGPLGKAGAIVDKTGNGLKSVRAEAGVWQAARDRTAGFLGNSRRDLGGFDRENGRKLGMDLGSIDELTRLRDATRTLGAEKKAEAPGPHKSPKDRLDDLDARRKQALDKLKARRDGEKRDDHRRERGLTGLKAKRDGFEAEGQAE